MLSCDHTPCVSHIPYVLSSLSHTHYPTWYVTRTSYWDPSADLILTPLHLSQILSLIHGPTYVGDQTQGAHLPALRAQKQHLTHCNMLMCSLQGRNSWCLKRLLLPRWLLSCSSDREVPFTESRDATCKTVDLNADKTWSDHFGWYVFFEGMWDAMD